MFSNCAFTFDVPAGTLDLSANSSGSTSNLFSQLSGMNFAADTYYFIALVGTPDNPQVFTFNLPSSSISGMLSNSTSGNNSGTTGTGGNG